MPSRVVLAPLGWRQVAEQSAATVTKRSWTPGRARSKSKTIAQGMPDQFGEPVVTLACVLLSFAHKAAGALDTRYSLRPLLGVSASRLGRIAPRDGDRVPPSRAMTAWMCPAGPPGSGLTIFFRISGTIAKGCATTGSCMHTLRQQVDGAQRPEISPAGESTHSCRQALAAARPNRD